MPILIREMRSEDARAFLEVHHAAVHAIAAKDYAPDVIDAWAPVPVTAALVEQIRSNPDNEYRLIAEMDGRAVGIGSPGALPKQHPRPRFRKRTSSSFA